MAVQNYLVDAAAYATINYNNNPKNPHSALRNLSIRTLLYNIIRNTTIQKAWNKNKIPFSYGSAKFCGGRIGMYNNQLQ